jgi:preprotein translocase subunit SecA
MRIFGSDRIAGIMTRLGMEEGQDIQHPLITRSIATAQRRVEEHNFEIRKHVLEYDNVMNKQREIVYGERRKILYSDDLKDYLDNLIEEVAAIGLDIYLNRNMRQDEWDYNGLGNWLKNKFLLDASDVKFEEMSEEEVRETVVTRLKGVYEAKAVALGPEAMKELQKVILLHVIDTRWKDHLYSMDNLREGIGLRAYGQRDPLVEYQHEGYEMFMDMIDSIKQETLEFLFKVQTVGQESRTGVFEAAPKQFTHEEKESFSDMPMRPAAQPEMPHMPRGRPQGHEAARPEPYKREEPKVGRNDPCPCGSGKKYKKCCGQ